MPGHNSNFNSTDYILLDRILIQNVHVGVIVVVTLLEICGMTRFYYIMPDLRLTLECFLLTAFFIFADTLVMTGMMKSKYADPGYLVPSQDEI